MPSSSLKPKSEALCEGGGRREDGPPDGRESVHDAGPVAVYQVARQQLTDRVGPEEATEDKAHLEAAEVQLVTDKRCGHRQVRAVDVVDRRPEEGHADDAPPDAGHRSSTSRHLRTFLHAGLPPSLPIDEERQTDVFPGHSTLPKPLPGFQERTPPISAYVCRKGIVGATSNPSHASHRSFPKITTQESRVA
jgi:hypothetical protein